MNIYMNNDMNIHMDIYVNGDMNIHMNIFININMNICWNIIWEEYLGDHFRNDLDKI